MKRFSRSLVVFALLFGSLVHVGIAETPRGSVQVDPSAGVVAGQIKNDNSSGEAKLDMLRGTFDAKMHTEYGASGEFTAESDLGSAKGKYTAGATVDSSLKVTADSVHADVTAQAGIAAELEAISKRVGVGDENIGLGAQASAKVEALIGAKGKIGAHIDKNGITIGAEAKAGAYISAEVRLKFDATFFGLNVAVTAVAGRHAGAYAEGKAIVHIGFNGKIKITLGAGLAVGIGGSLGLEFEVDASDLMKQHNLPDIAALLEWLDAFQKDPQAYLNQLIGDAINATVDAGITKATELVLQIADETEQVLVGFKEGIIQGVSNIIFYPMPWGKPEPTTMPLPNKATSPPPPPPGGPVKSTPSLNTGSEINEGYKRHQQYDRFSR